MSTAMPANTYQPKGMLIDGKWVDSASGAHFAVENPADESVVTELAATPLGEVRRAVAEARRSFDEGVLAGAAGRRGEAAGRLRRVVTMRSPPLNR